MAVYVNWMGDNFENAFLEAMSDRTYGAAKIFRRELSKVLAQTGKSPPASPDGSKIPYNRTGLLSRSWHATRAEREGTKFVARVGTVVFYAFWLIAKGRASLPGGRDYLADGLAWKQGALVAMRQRFDVKSMINLATRKLKKGGIGRRVT